MTVKLQLHVALLLEQNKEKVIQSTADDVPDFMIGTMFPTREVMSLKRWLLCLLVLTTTSLAIMCILYGDNGEVQGNKITCEIPYLDPWDASVKKYLPSNADNRTCPNARNLMYVNDSGFIHYDAQAIDFYSLSINSLKCKWMPVIRSLGDKQVSFGPQRMLSPPEFVESNVF